MRRLHIHRTLLLVLALSGSLAASGPQKSGPIAEVLVSVTDTQGKAVQNLKDTDFKIQEEGKAQSITSVTSASAIPTSVILLVDQSGSTHDLDSELAKTLNAAVRFFRSIFVPGRDKMGLVTFHSAAHFDQDFTDDFGVLIQTMNGTLGGGVGPTAVYDAVVATSRVLEARAGRRLVLLVGDGDDNASHASASDAIKAAQMADIAILSISTSTLRQTPSSSLFGNPVLRGAQSLENISKDTGGWYFQSSNLKQFDKVREELNGQYLVRYQSTNSKSNPEYRKIRVEVVKKGYKVRHRSGYWSK